MTRRIRCVSVMQLVCVVFVCCMIGPHNSERRLQGLSFRKPRLIPNGVPSIKRIDARFVQLQTGRAIQPRYQYPTRDEFKNISPDDVVSAVTEIINQNVFKEVILQTADMQYKLVTKLAPGSNIQTYHLKLSPVETKPVADHVLPSLLHDRTKETLLSVGEPFLQLLGVTTSTATARGISDHPPGGRSSDLNSPQQTPSSWPAARPRTGMADKLRQIEKFSEIVHGLVTRQFGPSATVVTGQDAPGTGTSTGASRELRVVDMGSGLGYLTFAVHTLLRRHFPGFEVSTVGVEQRGDLVTRTNAVARQLGEGYQRLSFVESTLRDYIRASHNHSEGVLENAGMVGRAHRRAATHRESGTESSCTGTAAAAHAVGEAGSESDGTTGQRRRNAVDILLALHACDTATDEALWHGVRSGAQIIVAAPCCHKELRRHFRNHHWMRDWGSSGIERTGADSGTTSGDAGGPKNTGCHPLSECLRYGTYEERTAEMVTDTLRALWLQYAGYDTKVFEFVPGEHTAKNVLITALKRRTVLTASERSAILSRIQQLKASFGVADLHIDRLMKLDV